MQNDTYLECEIFRILLKHVSMHDCTCKVRNGKETVKFYKWKMLDKVENDKL